MKVLFWLNTGKKNRQGKYPLYCRITINGERAEISTGIFLGKDEFDAKKKRVKSKNPLSEQYNKLIDELSHKINHTYYQQVFQGNIPTATEIKELHGQRKKRKPTVLAEVIEAYISEYHKIKQNEKLHLRHMRFLDIIKEYLSNHNKKHIRIDECNFHFYDDAAHYLYNEKKYSPAYIKKIIEFMRSAIRFAYNKGYTNKLPVEYTVPFKQQTEFIYLTEKEVDKIRHHKFSEARLQRIADCFMVQCYTGLAYIDLKHLNSTNIVIENDGLWININRQKVKSSEMVVPVLKNVKELLLKYNFNLPVISNQKYNAALKEIAKEVGIQKKLTSHVGRKTFGTLLLNKDVPIETVSRILGHSDVRITQKHYAKVLHMKIAKDLRLINF